MPWLLVLIGSDCARDTHQHHPHPRPTFPGCTSSSDGFGESPQVEAACPLCALVGASHVHGRTLHHCTDIDWAKGLPCEG